MNTVWSNLKEFYKTSFGFPEGLVELVSVMDILLLCVSGSSNKSIADFFGYDEFYVKRVLLEWLNFEGWRDDLILNPYKIYLKMVKNKTYDILDFIEEIFKVTEGRFAPITEVTTDMFKICQLYKRYEDTIKNEWY